MRMFVLGATGKTGGVLVAEALARGHNVTTFGRSTFSGVVSANLRDIRGDPLRAEQIAVAAAGQDAVLSVLGTRGLGATHLLEQSSRATIAGMQAAGIRRLVIVSSALLDRNVGVLSRVAERTLLRHHARDQRAMESVVTTSDLDWTVLRPARMSDSAPQGSVALAGAEPETATGMVITKREVARVLLDIAESGKWVRQIVHLRGASR
jgi:putative NADH-flavin reductase